MRNNNQILLRDQTACDEIFTGSTTNADTRSVRGSCLFLLLCVRWTSLTLLPPFDRTLIYHHHHHHHHHHCYGNSWLHQRYYYTLTNFGPKINPWHQKCMCLVVWKSCNNILRRSEKERTYFRYYVPLLTLASELTMLVSNYYKMSLCRPICNRISPCSPNSLCVADSVSVTAAVS